MFDGGCQVVLVATETPDVVDLGDAIGSFQHYVSAVQKGPVAPATPAQSPVKGAAGGKRDSVAALSPTSPGMQHLVCPPAIVFDRVGLGGDISTPVLEGAEYVTALLQTLNRLGDAKRFDEKDKLKELPVVVVVGCPSMDVVHALAGQTKHTIRMLVTLNASELFPPAPSAAPAKGVAKKPDPKKAAAKGGAKASGEKTSSPSQTVRIESAMKKDARFGPIVTFLRVHVPTTAAAEGVVIAAVAPELIALEKNLSLFTQWLEDKEVDRINVEDVGAEEERYVPSAFAKHLNMHEHKIYHRAVGDNLTMPAAVSTVSSASGGKCWKMEDSLGATLSQCAQNYALKNTPLRNVQQVDTIALEEMQRRRSAGVDSTTPEDQPPGLEEHDESQMLPRKGPPLFIQERPDISVSDPDAIQWMVRQFVKRSLGTLRLESDTIAELSNVLKGDHVESVDNSIPEGTKWASAALQSRTEHICEGVAAKGDTAVPSKRHVPVGTLLLRRACAARGATMMGLNPSDKKLPQIDDTLVAAIERSHTQREVQRGLSLTMLEQVTKEEYPYLAKAGFQTQPYLYSEMMSVSDMTRRVSQFTERFGEHNVKITRVTVDDSNNVNALASAISSAAQISKVPAPHEVVVVALDVPIGARSSVQPNHRCRASTSAAVASGMPSFPQYVEWTSAATSIGPVQSQRGDCTSQLSLRSKLSSSLSNNSTAAEVLKQRNFLQLNRASRHQQGSIVVGLSKLTVFPHDASVIEVHRRNASAAKGEDISHTVRFAKDDLVSTLAFSSTNGFPSFVTTFDDSTVVALQPKVELRDQSNTALDGFFGADASELPLGQQQRAPSPANSEAPADSVLSRLNSSVRPSRVGTTQSKTNDVSPIIMQRAPSQADLGFDPVPPSANSKSVVAAAAAYGKCTIPTFDVVVSYGDMSLQADEEDSSLTFRFSNQNIRESVVEGSLDGEGIQSFVEFEVGRRVDHSRGTVTRYFGSGSCQVLRPDGSVATMIVRDTHPQPFWLITSAIGEQFVKGAFPDAGNAVKLENFFCDVRQSTDRENNCDVFSRADGVLMTFYRRQKGEGYHTTVIVHADGTVLVACPGSSSPLDAASVPALAGLMKQIASVETSGNVAFVVETPRCPRVFLFHPRTAPSQRSEIGQETIREFLVAFGDGSLLRRQAVPKFANSSVVDEIVGPAAAEAKKNEVLLETVFCKAGESTVRFHHDTALVFVEAFSVRLSPLTTTSIALCEGVGVFDLALGGFRLVDFRAHTTCVHDVFETTSFPKVEANVPSNQTQLLLALAPAGYSPHILPKKKREALQSSVTKQQNDRGADGATVTPSLHERLRELTASYIVEHKLISKGPRRSQQAQLGATAVGTSRGTIDMASTNAVNATQTSKELVATTLSQLRAADQENSASYDPQIHPDVSPSTFGPFLTEVRPLLFVRYQDGSVSEFLCPQDVAPFIHQVNLAPRHVSVSRAYCSGEPGVEQLTFVGGEVSAFGSKSIRVSMDESPVEQAAWLPRTLLPPRRFLTSSAASMAQAEASKQVRTLLRYQPLSVTARVVTAKQEVRRQDQILAMHNYNESIQGSICVVPQADIESQNALRAKYLNMQPSSSQHASAGGVAGVDQNNPFASVAPYYAEDDGEPHEGEESARAGAAALPFDASAARKASIRRTSQYALKSFSFEPKEVDFGPLIAGLRYAFPVTLHSHTTDTLLFEVFRPKRQPNGVQLLSVQTSRFMVSPLGKSVVFVMINLPDDALETLQLDEKDPSGTTRIVRESLRMECAQLKSVVQLMVTATVSPSLSGVKSKLATPTPPLGYGDGPRKPKVDTLHPPVSGKELITSGYYGDLAMNTQVQVVGPAV